ncbi:ceramide synthase 2-like isoform X3 [Mobula birostris]|uniref:ceramide synthase 2-like isoform X3 n=1 Tax=Mobula birostris TaxID=1983395 RepID=UPI003B27D607
MKEKWRAYRMLQTLSDWFWWDDLWLPRNLTWDDLQDRDGFVYAKVSHLYVTILYAVLLMMVRYFFERLIATPLGKFMGIKDHVRLKATHNPVLEHFFVSISKHPNKSQLEGLSKKSSYSIRMVERWFRRRRNQDRPSLMKKFREACWRCTFYLLAFIGGIAVLIDKPWFYDTWEVWVGYPKQLAKMLHYAGWKSVCNSLFVVFAAVFIITRLIIFPFWIIHCTWVYPIYHYPAFLGYYFFNVMLVVLQLLHIFWAYLILRMLAKFLYSKLDGDDRSDKEECEDSDEDEGMKNGTGVRGSLSVNSHHAY